MRPQHDIGLKWSLVCILDLYSSLCFKHRGEEILLLLQILLQGLHQVCSSTLRTSADYETSLSHSNPDPQKCISAQLPAKSVSSTAIKQRELGA